MTTRAKLSAILEGLEFQSDQTRGWVDRRTGEVVMLSDEEIAAADEGDDPADLPEWMRDSIEQAKAVLADEAGCFVELPDRFDLDEWEMMRDFAASRQDEAIAGQLLEAIQGRGAFGRFKDRIHEAGVADDWYEYRADRYRQIALDWCEAHGLEVIEDE
jgi:hypothetical protein